VKFSTEMKTPLLSTYSSRTRMTWSFVRFFSFSLASYIAHRVRRLIGVCVGKNAALTRSDIFFQLHFIPLLRRKLKITAYSVPGEGPGSQAFLAMNAIPFARASGLDYLHSPFTDIFHADRPVAEWAHAWENFFNLGLQEKRATARDRYVIDFRDNFGMSRINERNMLCILTPEFRRKYYFDKISKQNRTLNVGIQIRRGEVTPDHYMWTDMATVAATLSNVNSLLKRNGIAHVTRVFSQGQTSDFVEREPFNVELLLNAGALWSMKELIECDVLIMAKSRFSYVAAILCDGIKIYEPFEDHPTLSGWLVRDVGGKFDIDDFERQLRKLEEEGRAP
jgi:hypothetical protein